MKTRTFAKVGDVMEIPRLVDLQVNAYEAFLQLGVRPEDREKSGLDAILREIFPIKSYDGTMSLEYIRYDLGRPRYNADECRKLKLTYGLPFTLTLRLDRPEPIEEDVYLGDIPRMLGGGEFIMNGAERVIVTQLHRSPGVDFTEEVHAGEKKVYSCRIIPERGSWIEVTSTKRDLLTVRIDQGGTLFATTLLRAMSEEYSTNADLIQLFYKVEKAPVESGNLLKKLKDRFLAERIVNAETGEILAEAGSPIDERIVNLLREEKDRKSVQLVAEVDDPLILNTLAEDPTHTFEEALLKIYARLRPGNPPQVKKAKELFHDKFFDPNRYRLGRVGRFRLNRKFEQDIPEIQMTLTKDDFLNSIRYILDLRKGKGTVDDIDHLGNRRLRTIDELAGDEFRKGFLKLKRTVQERMSLKERTDLTPRTLINAKTVSSSIEYFFGRGELSQVVDQTNPLSMLTHERRLSALGPGGLNRKRAGFEVRDVHISHYGRICPIETPEGTNIGLIASLSIYAGVDPYGFLITPYRVVKNGRLTGDVAYIRADEEDRKRIAPADTSVDKDGRIPGEDVLARYQGDFCRVQVKDLDFMDISPKQMVGVSAALIPFLEHDDANRALMGSNMQRQAVPLLITEPPLVATGIEKSVPRNSSMVVLAEEDGKVTKVTGELIVIGHREYPLRKYAGLNERTCLNQRPIVREGEPVKKGQVIADGAGTYHGELALGKNVLVGFMVWDGFNFEDAVIVSEKLIKEDAFTSIHIEEFEIEIRETKLGKEEFTRDIPNVSERALKNLDERGVVRIGTKVLSADILVGKVAPKSKTELSPEEKLLRAIFGRAGENVKNDSLEVPSGVEGVVIDAQRFSRRSYLTEEERKAGLEQVRKLESTFNRKITRLFREMVEELEKEGGAKLRWRSTGEIYRIADNAATKDLLKLDEDFNLEHIEAGGKRPRGEMDKLFRGYRASLESLKNERDRKINQLKRGDELPTGVLEMVKVYVATKRNLCVGDKVAGRHGNKGVVSKVLPEEDMPFLEDGTPVEVLLNPLGVPSRMNVGQILETHLGWAAKTLGFQAVTPVFDGASEQEIRDCLKEAGLPEDGKVNLYDGRTGLTFEQKVTVGYLYIMKLHHLVDDKIHARATGPYSLITQQPLGGKARFGGQRFGEMEVWALEAYGAAHILQELLTVKSDDVEGRTKIYESMVKGENTLVAGTPVSFEVLTNEIRGLGLNLELGSGKDKAFIGSGRDIDLE